MREEGAHGRLGAVERAPRPCDRSDHALGERGEHLLEHRVVERVLRAEVVGDRPEVGVRLAGDRADGRAVVAPARELAARRRDERRAGGRPPWLSLSPSFSIHTFV